MYGQVDAPFELDEENARKLKWALIMLGVVSHTLMLGVDINVGSGESYVLSMPSAPQADDQYTLHSTAAQTTQYYHS